MQAECEHSTGVFYSLLLQCTFACILCYLHFNLDAYLDAPSLLSSVPGGSEREGWGGGGGPARVKPSALIDTGLESKEEQGAAEAGLDLWPGMAGEQKENLTFHKCQHIGGVIHGVEKKNIFRWFSAACFYLEEASNHGRERYHRRNGPAPHTVPDGGLRTYTHTRISGKLHIQMKIIAVKPQTTTYKQISSWLHIWHSWGLPVCALRREGLISNVGHIATQCREVTNTDGEEKHFNNKGFDLSQVMCEAKTTPCLCCCAVQSVPKNLTIL